MTFLLAALFVLVVALAFSACLGSSTLDVRGATGAKGAVVSGVETGVVVLKSCEPLLICSEEPGGIRLGGKVWLRF